LLFRSLQKQILDRSSFVSGLFFQFTVKRVGNVDSRPHNAILPYLWLNGYRILIRTKCRTLVASGIDP